MRARTIKSTFFLGAALATAALSVDLWAQDIDRKKSGREIEIMNGILQATVKFATEEVGTVASPQGWSRQSVRGYHLFDQGATFIIDLPTPASPGMRSSTIRQQLAVAKTQGASEREAILKRQQNDVRQQLESYRESLESIHSHLIEALANHGDSLTFVRDDEYVNLILATGSRLGAITDLLTSFSEPRSASHSEVEVLSVKKSWIKDYKAGRLSLVDFKAKVLNY